MYILLTIIGVIGLGGVIFIVSKKLHSLSLVDVEKATPKAKKVKEQIIASRFKRILDENSIKSKNFFKSMSAGIKTKVDKAVDRLMQMEASAKLPPPEAAAPAVTATQPNAQQKTLVPPKAPTKAEREKSKLAEILEDAARLAKTDDWKLAEGKYIEAIKMDQKNPEAYMGLGRLYAENDKYSEARQIFEFLMKLKIETPELYLEIANLAWEENNLDEAKIYYLKALSLDGTRAIARINLGLVFIELGDKTSAAQQFAAALELEPKNPRYLDLIIDSAIKIDEKELALRALKGLEDVNPENQKIKEFKKKIREMA